MVFCLYFVILDGFSPSCPYSFISLLILIFSLFTFFHSLFVTFILSHVFLFLLFILSTLSFKILFVLSLTFFFYYKKLFWYNCHPFCFLCRCICRSSHSQWCRRSDLWKQCKSRLQYSSGTAILLSGVWDRSEDLSCVFVSVIEDDMLSQARTC